MASRQIRGSWPAGLHIPQKDNQFSVNWRTIEEWSRAENLKPAPPQLPIIVDDGTGTSTITNAGTQLLVKYNADSPTTDFGAVLFQVSAFVSSSATLHAHTGSVNGDATVVANGTDAGAGWVDITIGGSHVVRVGNDGLAGGAAITLQEQAQPSTPPTDSARLWIEDNGVGKTRLRIIFDDGSIVTIATQP